MKFPVFVTGLVTEIRKHVGKLKSANYKYFSNSAHHKYIFCYRSLFLSLY